MNSIVEKNAVIDNQTMYIMETIYTNRVLKALFLEIDSLTADADFKVVQLIIRYCLAFEDRYDGFFWSNEGFNYLGKWEMDIIKKIDIFFVECRKAVYGKQRHIPYYDKDEIYYTVSDYLLENLKK